MQMRPCGPDDHPALVEVINAAARKYEGVIPADCWRWPYMAPDELAEETAKGVTFLGAWRDGALCGVMGLQDRGEVRLIRHAYVRPRFQGLGLGGRLLGRLCASGDKPILVGTWTAADWAVGFYRRHGFSPAGAEDARRLLAAHWSIPPRQAEASVVLVRPAH